MSYRDIIIGELIETERQYIHDLEKFYKLQILVEEKEILSKDTAHDIFQNITSIVDFQRRFLVEIESMNSLPESKQYWGQPFVINEESFLIYEPFICNRRKATNTAKREFDKIVNLDNPLVVDFTTLDGFLLNMLLSRLAKYPCLLRVCASMMLY